MEILYEWTRNTPNAMFANFKGKMRTLYTLETKITPFSVIA